MSASPEPDYYRILQVHPEADQDVIEAAYHRLVRKYHPDALGGAEPDDAAQQMIRQINAAWEVLGDPDKRRAYDARLRGGPRPDSTVDRRTIPGRCGKTRQTFEIVLARKAGSSDPFRVVGFSQPDPSAEPAGDAAPSNAALALVNRLFQPKQEKAKGGFSAPSDDELEAMFDDRNKINFSDIRWDMRCPACEGGVPNSSGGLTTWSICGSCAKVSCTGGAMVVSGVITKVCPWCMRKQTISIGSGRSKLSVQSSGGGGEPKRLSARPTLPPGEEKKPG